MFHQLSTIVISLFSTSSVITIIVIVVVTPFILSFFCHQISRFLTSTCPCHSLPTTVLHKIPYIKPQGPFKKANMMTISQFHTRQLQSILTELHIFVSWFAVCFGFRWEHLPSLNWARLCRAALCDPRRAIGGMAGKAATEQFLGEIVWNN